MLPTAFKIPGIANNSFILDIWAYEGIIRVVKKYYHGMYTSLIYDNLPWFIALIYCGYRCEMHPKSFSPMKITLHAGHIFQQSVVH